MYQVDIHKLNGKIIERQTTKEALAICIGVNKTTFYRRLKRNKLLIGDMHKITEALSLSRQEAYDIFLSEKSQ